MAGRDLDWEPSGRGHLARVLDAKGNVLDLATASTDLVELAAGPFVWKGRQLMYALVRDITERKRVEHELRASEHQMRLITVPGLPTPTPKPTSDRPNPEDTAIPCYYDQNNALICP